MTFDVKKAENTCRPEWRCDCVLTVFAATENWPSGFSFRSQDSDEVSTFKRAEIGGYPVRTSREGFSGTFPGLTGYVQDWVNGVRENFGFVIAPTANPLAGGNLREEFSNECIADMTNLQLHVTIARREGT